MTRPIALVTGASSGIGEHLARQLAERGHDLVLVARDQRPARGARQGDRGRVRRDRAGAAGRSHRSRRSSRSSRTAVTTASAPIDVLVNNAGFGTFGPFHTLDLDTEIREIQLNVVALVRLTHAAAAEMVARGRGGILNVSSLAGLPARTVERDLRRDEGVRDVVHRGGARGAEGHRRVGHGAVPGLHAHRVPGARRTCPPSEVPGFMWQEADEVATRRPRRAGEEPGDRDPGRGRTRCSATFSSVTPHAITRRLGGAVLKRVAH